MRRQFEAFSSKFLGYCLHYDADYGPTHHGVYMSVDDVIRLQQHIPQDKYPIGYYVNREGTSVIRCSVLIHTADMDKNWFSKITPIETLDYRLGDDFPIPGEWVRVGTILWYDGMVMIHSAATAPYYIGVDLSK